MGENSFNYDLNVLDALTTQAIYFLSILLVAARIARRENLAQWLGVPLLMTSIPLAILLIQGIQQGRTFLYMLAIILMLFWLAVKLVLDYLIKIDFRHIPWASALYLLLFLIATGGMNFVVFQAGIFWFILSISFYAILVILIFVRLFTVLSKNS